MPPEVWCLRHDWAAKKKFPRWFGWNQPGLLVFGIVIMKDSTRKKEVEGASMIGFEIGSAIGAASLAYDVEVHDDMLMLRGRFAVVPDDTDD